MSKAGAITVELKRSQAVHEGAGRPALVPGGVEAVARTEDRSQHLPFPPVASGQSPEGALLFEADPTLEHREVLAEQLDRAHCGAVLINGKLGLAQVILTGCQGIPKSLPDGRVDRRETWLLQGLERGTALPTVIERSASVFTAESRC